MNLNKSVLFPLKDDNLMEINGITLKEKTVCSIYDFGPVIIFKYHLI